MTFNDFKHVNIITIVRPEKYLPLSVFNTIWNTSFSLSIKKILVIPPSSLPFLHTQIFKLHIIYYITKKSNVNLNASYESCTYNGHNTHIITERTIIK